MEQHQVKIDTRFLVERNGREFALFAGLLDAAHRDGLKSIETSSCKSAPRRTTIPGSFVPSSSPTKERSAAMATPRRPTSAGRCSRFSREWQKHGRSPAPLSWCPMSELCHRCRRTPAVTTVSDGAREVALCLECLAQLALHAFHYAKGLSIGRGHDRQAWREVLEREVTPAESAPPESR